MRTHRPHPEHENRALHLTLWLAQVFLFAAFGLAGLLKLTMPVTGLAEAMGWPADVPPWLVRSIGAAELAGALGVLAPGLLRLRPMLVPVAAAALLLLMALAAVFHLLRGELAAIGLNMVLAAIAGFVAWGRSRRVPVAAR
jgi:putative oxidoreductase